MLVVVVDFTKDGTKADNLSEAMLGFAVAGELARGLFQ